MIAMAIVYMATNTVNGKRYIGCTRQTMKARRSGHESDAFTNMVKTRFANALRKYGRSAFEWTIMAEYPSLKEAFAGEVATIAAHKPEYNLTAGGEGPSEYRHTDAAKAKMSAAHKGKPNLKARGKKRTPEFVELMRTRGLDSIEIFKQYAALGPAAMARRVICLDTGEEFESASAAARAHGVARSAIIELCQGKRTRQTVGGKRFQYVGAPPVVDPNRRSSRKLNAEQVEAIRLLKGALSQTQAGKMFGVSGATIGDIWRGTCWKKAA